MNKRVFYIISIIALAAACAAAIVTSLCFRPDAAGNAQAPLMDPTGAPLEAASDPVSENPGTPFVAAAAVTYSEREVAGSPDSSVASFDSSDTSIPETTTVSDSTVVTDASFTSDPQKSSEEEYDGWFRGTQDKKWRYKDPEGNVLYGWQFIENEWYYLMPDTGIMAENCWVRDDNGIPCYLKDDGMCVYGGLTWIGDSLSANWDPAHAIQELFYNPHVAAKSLKSICEDYDKNPSALTIAKGMVMAGTMQKTLVFEMGSNNDWHTPDLSYADKIGMLRDIIGKDVKIILVTCYTVDDATTEIYYGDLNRDIRRLAQEDPHIAVADWAAICDPETDLNPKDGLHHKDYAAARKYIKLIQDTLIENFGPESN